MSNKIFYDPYDEIRDDIFGEHGEPNQGAFWNLYDSIIAVRDLIKKAWNEGK